MYVGGAFAVAGMQPGFDMCLARAPSVYHLGPQLKEQHEAGGFGSLADEQ